MRYWPRECTTVHVYRSLSIVEVFDALISNIRPSFYVCGDAIIIIYWLRRSSLHADIKTIKAVHIKKDNTKNTKQQMQQMSSTQTS